MGTLLQPKTITVQDGDGNDRDFIISKFPAVQGREIIAKYPMSNLPKLGDYKVSEEIMLKLMAYVAIENNGNDLRLTTLDLINNHTGDWECLGKVEWAMMEYNCSFFRNGRISDFLQGFVQRTLQSIFKMLTDSSAQSSQPEKQASTN